MTRLTERPKHLIGGDVEEAEVGISGVGGRILGRRNENLRCVSICPILSFRNSGFRDSETPMFPRYLKQSVGADDIGLDELAGSINGAVHVGFCCKMHDPVRVEVGESFAHGSSVADVRVKESVIWMVHEIRERTRITRVGEFVDVENSMALGYKKMDKIGADETGSACDENFYKDYQIVCP